MGAIAEKIPIKQGEEFSVELTVLNTDTNLPFDYSTGFTARMQIRQTEQDDTIRDELRSEVTTAFPEARITLSDGIPPTSSTETTFPNVVMTWDTEESEALDLNDSTVRQTYPGVGDLEIIDSTGEVVTSIRLEFAQTLEVTK